MESRESDIASEKTGDQTDAQQQEANEDEKSEIDANVMLQQMLDQRGQRIHTQAMADLEVETQRLQAERQLLAAKDPKTSDVLTLDIGGKETIKVMRSLLTSVEGSRLEEMFAGDYELPILENGVVFIDRDPETFLLVISFLRNDCQIPAIKDEYLNKRFELEMNYWGLELSTPIEELVKVFSERISTCYAGVAEIADQAGPFDLKAAIEQGKIEPPYYDGVKKIQLSHDVLYVGQPPNQKKKFIGKIESVDCIIEGVFAFDTHSPFGMSLDGYGRHIRAKILFEGFFVKGVRNGWMRQLIDEKWQGSKWIDGNEKK